HGRRPGRAQVVPGDDRLYARVDLTDVGHRGGAERVAGDADAARVQAGVQRVVGRVAAVEHAGPLLDGVARPGRARRAREVWARRLREEEVERILRAVVERLAGLRRDAVEPVGALPVGVRPALPLRVPGHHDVAGAREVRGGVPVELLGRLDRAVGDHDARAALRAGVARPNVARERGAVAGGE